jgi:hypothetical protein
MMKRKKLNIFISVLMLISIVLCLSCSKDSNPATPDTTIPSAPTGLAVQALLHNTLTLTWNASTGASLYLVYRAQAQAGPYDSIAATTVTSYADTGLPDSTTYHYKVKAQNSAGTSGFSASDSGTTLGASQWCVVTITADIDSVTTWQSGCVYIIRAYDFYVNNTLTIEPSVIIKFHSNDAPYMGLSGSGTIIAKGKVDSPIVFTSYKDDAHGGDNNGDGNATSPASKDWSSVFTNATNGSVFEYCEFYYGGSGSYTRTLAIETGSRATVRHCTFAHNDGSDASGGYGALDASTADAGTVIENNVFYDNVRPLSTNCLFSLDGSNIFHNPDSAAQTNTYNGIFMETIDHISGHITLLEDEVPYVIDDNDFWVNSGATLTLGDNVVLKFRPTSVMLLEDGISALVNYDGPGVYFTSYRDDTKKGDTNADGSATSPADNDWGGIYDDTYTVGDGYFRWANILYDSYN